MLSSAEAVISLGPMRRGKWPHHGAKRDPLVVKYLKCRCKGRVTPEKVR